MFDPYRNLSFPNEGFSITPIAAHLYVPPITWRGDPVGHIGKYDCFFFVLSGECYVKIDDISFVLKEGQLAFLPKGKMRTYTTMSPGFTMYEIAFEFKLGKEDWSNSISTSFESYCVDISDTAALSELFEGCVRHEFNKDMLYNIICFSNIAAIARIYLEAGYEAEIKAKPFSEVVKYIELSLNRQIKVEELAKIACMQTTYFIKKFKAAFGISPINYINKQKIYRSMTLLLSTDLSVEKIAQSIGIFDNSYYSRIFKKHCSLSPVEYRRLFKR